MVKDFKKKGRFSNQKKTLFDNKKDLNYLALVTWGATVLHFENKNLLKKKSAKSILVKINGVIITAILDTGAGETLISTPFAKEAN